MGITQLVVLSIRCTPFKKSELARMNIDRKLKTLRKQIDE